MGQILQQDNIPPLIRASSTTCTLAATHLGKTTRITISGQQYALSGTLTLNTATTGLGGLDTGSLGAVQLWYVYACANSSGVVGLVASQTGPSTGPSGFTSRYALVGAFYTDGTSVIGSTVTIDGTAKTDWIAITPGITNFGSQTAVLFYFKRDGETMHVRGGFTSGTPAAGQAGILLPASLTVSTIYSGRHVMVGYWSSGATSSDGQRSILAHNASGSDRVFFGYISVGQNGYDIQNGNNLPVSSGQGVVVDFSVIISSWAKTLLG